MYCPLSYSLSTLGWSSEGNYHEKTLMELFILGKLSGIFGVLPFLRLSKVQSLCFWQKVDVCLSIWFLGVGLGIFFAQCQN